MKKKNNRFKPTRKIHDGDISPEEWVRLNKEHFGEDNATWLPEKNEDDDKDETDEISFDY